MSFFFPHPLQHRVGSMLRLCLVNSYPSFAWLSLRVDITEGAPYRSTAMAMFNTGFLFHAACWVNWRFACPLQEAVSVPQTKSIGILRRTIRKFGRMSLLRHVTQGTCVNNKHSTFLPPVVVVMGVRSRSCSSVPQCQTLPCKTSRRLSRRLSRQHDVMTWKRGVATAICTTRFTAATHSPLSGPQVCSVLNTSRQRETNVSWNSSSTKRATHRTTRGTLFYANHCDGRHLAMALKVNLLGAKHSDSCW